MKKSMRFLPCLSGLLLLFFTGCTPKPDLEGTWQPQMSGDNSLTLNRDGTAFVSIDMEMGLLGNVRGTSQGTWKQVEKDRLLLEMETAGVRTSEISRFVLQDGDLILTSEKNGQSMRYRRVSGASNSAANAISSSRRIVPLSADAVESQVRASGIWRSDLFELTRAKVTLLSQSKDASPFKAELELRAKVSTYRPVEIVKIGTRQFTLVEAVLVRGQDFVLSYEASATGTAQGVIVTAPPPEAQVGLHRLDSLGKPGNSFTNAVLVGTPEGERVRNANRALADADKFLRESRTTQWAYDTALSALDGKIGMLDAETAFVHLYPTVADELRNIRIASYRPDESRLRAFRKRIESSVRKGAEDFTKQLAAAKKTLAEEADFLAKFTPQLP